MDSATHRFRLANTAKCYSDSLKFKAVQLGCSQAVRHRILIPAYPGSNPGTPAIAPIVEHGPILKSPASTNQTAKVAIAHAR